MRPLEMVDHVGFEEMLSRGPRMTRERMEHLFSSKMFYSHRNKQSWGVYREQKDGRWLRPERRIYDGKLESDKQNAFYVGFVGGRIHHPTKFRARRAHKQLRYTLGAFEDIACRSMMSLSSLRGPRGATPRRLSTLCETRLPDARLLQNEQRFNFSRLLPVGEPHAGLPSAIKWTRRCVGFLCAPAHHRRHFINFALV
jgi:hypothetical protein